MKLPRFTITITPSDAPVDGVISEPTNLLCPDCQGKHFSARHDLCELNVLRCCTCDWFGSICTTFIDFISPF